MTGDVHLPRHDDSPLGCRLHDWSLVSRECPSPSAGRERRGLIIDLDETLYEHEQFVRSGFMAVARHVERAHGVSTSAAFGALVALRRSGPRGTELQVLCRRFGLAAGNVPQLLEVYRTHRPVLRLPETSAAVLATLRGMGWRIAILTNGIPSVQRAKVSALGLHACVDAVVCAEEHAPGGKPAAAAFREALRRISVPARRAVCIGDDPVCDIAGASRLGIAAVHLVTRGKQAAPDADAVIDSLEALPCVASQLLEASALDAA
jgi:putative hydrolase of the HAD superfamily